MDQTVSPSPVLLLANTKINLQMKCLASQGTRRTQHTISSSSSYNILLLILIVKVLRIYSWGGFETLSLKQRGGGRGLSALRLNEGTDTFKVAINVLSKERE